MSQVLATVASRLEPAAYRLFERGFLDTLDRTLSMQPDRSVFVVTGDIPAMWLRDSTTQLAPYLHFLDQDGLLADTVCGVVRRQFELILLDPYANAFNRTADGAGHTSDITDRHPHVWERKFELDSLCFPLQLAHDVWRITGRVDHLERLRDVAESVLEVFTAEQDHDARSPYRFERLDGPASDTLVRGGLGRPVQPVGLVWSGFRPSDDACELGFNIPGNMFVAVAMDALAELAREVLRDEALEARAGSLAITVRAAIDQHAVTRLPDGETVYAYEVDGHGGALFMDDANMPSLLSLPLIGWCTAADPLYRRTRSAVLSSRNPYYYSGAHAAGVGSPHTPAGMVWPIGLAVQGLTSEDPGEARHMLETILATDGGTGMVHESFDPDQPGVYTREWFSWANAMFCELALEVAGLRTHVRVPRVGIDGVRA